MNYIQDVVYLDYNMGRGPEYKRTFESLLGNMGIDFQRDPSVRIGKAVMDKNGKWEKTVATPDYRIVLNGNEEIFIELTRNGLNTEHKRAQRRVIAVAGKLGDFYTITKHIVDVAEGFEDVKKGKKYLSRKLGKRL